MWAGRLPDAPGGIGFPSMVYAAGAGPFPYENAVRPARAPGPASGPQIDPGLRSRLTPPIMHMLIDLPCAAETLK
jgi:hypothetical protein